VQNRINSALLGLAALAVIGGAVAAGTAHHDATPASGLPVADIAVASDRGALVRAADKASPPTAAQQAAAAQAQQAAVQESAQAKAQQVAQQQAAQAAAQQQAQQADAQAAAAPAQWWLTNSDVQLQPNYYYCGPAATRIALSAHGKAMNFDQIAGLLGTTEGGTNSAIDVTRVMNQVLGQNRYHTTEIPGERATPQQMDKLQADIVAAISHGDVVVANIKGTVQDADGDVHSYEGGHYLTVVGYSDHGRMARIGDPASPGKTTYDLSTIDLANWIASRGYSS
jgi:hypothetical protein